MQENLNSNHESILDAINQVGVPEVDRNVLRQYLLGELSPKSMELVENLVQRSSEWASALANARSEQAQNE